MFDEKDISKYRSIKAPEELKGRVEKALSENRKAKQFSFKSFIAVAASFVIILSVLLVSGLSNGGFTLMYNGQRVSKEGCDIAYPSQPLMARLESHITIPFEIKGGGEIRLTVSEGVLTYEGAQEEGKDITLLLSGKETVYLENISVGDLPLKLTCKTESGTVVYVIKYDGKTALTVYKDAETKN